MGKADIRPRVCGVDGCRRGWVVAHAGGVAVVRNLQSVVDDFDVIGVDMPIGLVDSGPRACDNEARRFLSPRGATVFPAPARMALRHSTYAEANAATKAALGKGLSRQAFNLVPKVIELDRLAASHPEKFVEIHPECSFARMAGRVLPSKHSADGLQRRREFVETHLGVTVHEAPSGAALDDVLDAWAVLWSVRRFVRGEHVEFGDGSLDPLGLPMRIVS